jgi:hypothetical protein
MRYCECDTTCMWHKRVLQACPPPRHHPRHSCDGGAAKRFLWIMSSLLVWFHCSMKQTGEKSAGENRKDVSTKSRVREKVFLNAWWKSNFQNWRSGICGLRADLAVFQRLSSSLLQSNGEYRKLNNMNNKWHSSLYIYARSKQNHTCYGRSSASKLPTVDCFLWLGAIARLEQKKKFTWSSDHISHGQGIELPWATIASLTTAFVGFSSHSPHYSALYGYKYV